MTKVEVRYSLASPPDEALLAALGRAQGMYGLLAVKLSPAMDSLVVLFDASRLRRTDVDAALRRAGVPAMPQS